MTDQPNNFDPLDDLLAQARWPEPSAAAIERLTHSWRQLHRRRSIAFPALAAVAAVIGVVIGCWVVLSSQDTRPAPVIVLSKPPQKSLPSPRVEGRPPSGLEKTLLAAQLRRDAKTAPRTKVPPPAQAVAAVAEPVVPIPPPDVRPLLEQIADAKTREAALDSLGGESSPLVDQLVRRLNDPRADLRVAAALALGRIDGPAITQRLIRMISQGRNRREAFIALASSRGAEAQAFMREATQSETFAALARSSVAAAEIQRNEVQ